MNLTLIINAWLDEDLMFVQQLGVKHVLAQVDLRQAAAPDWPRESLTLLRNRIEKAAFSMAGIAVVMQSPAVDGFPGSNAPAALDETAALETLVRLIEEAGVSGIQLVRPPDELFHFPARQKLPPEKLTLVLNRLAEAAAAAGVKLALPTGGVLSRLKRAQLLAILQPPCLGLDATPALLLALLSELPAAGRAADGSQAEAQGLWDKILLSNLENNLKRGTRPLKTRVDAGAFNIPALCWRLKQAGYSGYLCLGQQPHWSDDSAGGHRALAFGAGYLQAILQANSHFPAL